MPSLKTKAEGIWREAKGCKINLSGQWKTVANMWTKIDNIWRAKRFTPWESEVFYLPVSEGTPTCTPPFPAGQAGTLYCRVTLPHPYTEAATGNKGEIKEMFVEVAKVRNSDGVTTGGHVKLDIYFNERSDMESLAEAIRTDKLVFKLASGAPNASPNRYYTVPNVNLQAVPSESNGVYKLACLFPDNGNATLYSSLEYMFRYPTFQGGPVDVGIYAELRKQ